MHLVQQVKEAPGLDEDVHWVTSGVVWLLTSPAGFTSFSTLKGIEPCVF
jgi:hypothetical protein